MLSSVNDEVQRSISDDDDENENSNDEQEEQVAVMEQVPGLFSTEIFANVIEMFRAYRPQFDLVRFLRTHQIVSQYDYIRLINYIRLEQPSMDDLNQLQPGTVVPWSDEKYFVTALDDDPALQFDIEEDLSQLGDETISTTKKDDELAIANERIRQLEEMVQTLK